MNSIRFLQYPNKQGNRLKLSKNHRKKNNSRLTVPYRSNALIQKVKISKEDQISFDEGIRQQIRKKHEKLLQVYGWGLEFYPTIEIKLLNLIRREMISKNYVYENQLLKLLKNKESTEEVEDAETGRYLNEVEKIIQFLVSFYEKRKAKEITIIEERLIDEEKFMSDKMGYQQYNSVYQKLSLGRLPLTFCDIEEQYQNICLSYGREDRIIHPHKSIKNSLERSSKTLYKTFEEKLQVKGNRQFVIKQFKKTKNYC